MKDRKGHHLLDGKVQIATAPEFQKLLEFGTQRSLWPCEWPAPFWFPIIALKPLESLSSIPARVHRRLGKSRRAREWALGSWFWYVWKQRMKEVMEPAYRFVPLHHVAQIRELLELPSHVQPAITPAPAPALPFTLVEEVVTISPVLRP